MAVVNLASRAGSPPDFSRILAMEHSTGSHTKFHHRYHIVWCPKYRYKVLNGEVRLRVREIIRHVCAQLQEWKPEAVALLEEARLCQANCHLPKSLRSSCPFARARMQQRDPDRGRQRLDLPCRAPRKDGDRGLAGRPRHRQADPDTVKSRVPGSAVLPTADTRQPESCCAAAGSKAV